MALSSSEEKTSRGLASEKTPSPQASQESTKQKDKPKENQKGMLR